jgi:hypothetical protein
MTLPWLNSSANNSLSALTLEATMFRVDRPLLLGRISEATGDRSVVVTGSPGIGKSWIIAQFVRNLKATRRPHLPLSAEDFDVRSIDELTRALKLKTDLITLIGSLGEDSVLIVDGLDALRSEASQRTFRQLIGAVNAKVPQCAILASIRTFDLQQSRELQRLFFAPITTSGRQFTEITVGSLSIDELASVSVQIPDLEPLLRESTGEFQELVRNPFNLHLCVLLLKRGIPWPELSAAQSQAQLMGIYWDVRVNRPSDGLERRSFLRRLLRRMVERNALSLPEEAMDSLGVTPLFNVLRSDEILRSSATGRLSFSHNILFDYAVARLLLDEESLLRFITEDPSRTIFFRPSISFHFHFLWLTDRELFWKGALGVLASIDVPERARVTAAVAIYESADKLADLDPLFTPSASSLTLGVTSLLRAVQAFGGMHSRRRRVWLGLLGKLADRPSLEFINEYVGMLSAASESTINGDEGLIAMAARKLLRWMWGQLATLGPDRAAELADLGAARVLPVILKFYSSDKDASKQIVLDLLNRVELHNSGPHEASRLAHEMNFIVQNDPNLAMEAYRRLFAHQETSETTTAIGGPVFQMRGTRRQDFFLALYELQTAFGMFLQSAPVHAATAAIQSVNAEVPREHKGADAKASFKFRFMGKDALFVSDYSEIWDRGGRDHLSLELLDSALNHAAKLLTADSGSEPGAAIIRAVGQESSYAVCWKRLLEACGRSCNAFYPVIRQLLTIPRLLAAPETTIEVGEVLKVAYRDGLVDETDAVAIEKAILRIAETEIIERYEKPASIRNRLLMCIPPTLLITTESKELSRTLIEAQSVPENKPFHRTTFSTLSEEEVLRFQGVDPTDPDNAKLVEVLKPLESFERKYLNEVPTVDECDAIAPTLRQLRILLTEVNVQEKLAERARGTLCATAEVIVRNAKVQKDGPLWDFCRDILLRGARDHSPEFDPKYHLRFDRPSWGGPAPRIEAAQGLAHIIWNWGFDSEVLQMLQTLSTDLVPAVRFQVANGIIALYKQDAKQEFWALAETMIQSEQTSGVMLGIVSTLGKVAQTDSVRVVDLLSVVIRRGFMTAEQGDVADHLLGILIWLYVWRDDPGANQQLMQFEEDASLNHRALVREAFEVAGYFRMENEEQKVACGRARALTERILAAVYRAWRLIAPDAAPETKAESIGNLLAIIDQVASRLYLTFQGDSTREGQSSEDGSSRRALYFELKPIFDALVLYFKQPEQQHLAAPTAHHLMQTFNAVLDYDPATVVEYAAAVCQAASGAGYHFDHMAISEAVKLAQRVLADHKDVLRVRRTATALGEVLDTFVKAGWPEAVRLAYTVDEAVR